MRFPVAPSAIVVLFWTVAAWAFARAELGSVIENVEMPTLDGGRHHLLTNAAVNVFIFFRPGQEHSQATLKQVAACEKEMAGKSVHWVVIVSDRFSKEDVAAEVRQTGITMPVLIDVGDALYGRLGVALAPVTGIADKDHKLAVYLPFTKVNYGTVLSAHIRHLLKEITDQELDQVLNPPAATQGGDAEVARRRLKLAEKLFLAGSYERALESAKKSIERDPTLAASHVLIGRILSAQGKRVEAMQAFARALELDPGNTSALEGKKSLEDRAK